MDTHSLNADLHCHSHVSDGTLAPAEVVRRAHANGVELLALTDHDETGGLDEAADAARALGLRFLAGVEVSVTWAHETIHVVGLGVDRRDPQLLQGLAATRGGRDARGREMADQLAQVGIPGAYEGAMAYAGNPALLSRTHFARYMVDHGFCADVAEVFRDYLVEGKPGFVPHRWARLGDAVRWISEAGGLAVLAHPARYDLTDQQLSALVDEFRTAGGRGIEVISGSHSPEDVERFAGIARHAGLLASRGSDFHDPDESRFDLGRMPPLPASLTPTWTALADRWSSA